MQDPSFRKRLTPRALPLISGAFDQMKERKTSLLGTAQKPNFPSCIALKGSIMFGSREIREKFCVIDTLGLFFICLRSKLLAVNSSANSPAAPVICLNGGIPMVHL